MPKSYLVTGLVLAIDALAIAAVSAILCLAYWLATGGNGAYLPLLSNLLFFEGAVVVVFGAVTEFFHLGRTAEIYRLLMLPSELIGVHEATDESVDEEDKAGWPLIFLGAMLLAMSIAASFEYLI